MIAGHLGALHPAEGAATIALALGPFVLLGIVIAVRRLADRRRGLPQRPNETAQGDEDLGPGAPDQPFSG